MLFTTPEFEILYKGIYVKSLALISELQGDIWRGNFGEISESTTKIVGFSCLLGWSSYSNMPICESGVLVYLISMFVIIVVIFFLGNKNTRRFKLRTLFNDIFIEFLIFIIFMIYIYIVSHLTLPLKIHYFISPFIWIIVSHLNHLSYKILCCNLRDRACIGRLLETYPKQN